MARRRLITMVLSGALALAASLTTLSQEKSAIEGGENAVHWAALTSAAGLPVPVMTLALPSGPRRRAVRFGCPLSPASVPAPL